MEVICLILATGWFAVGWLAASAYHRRSRPQRLEPEAIERDRAVYRQSAMASPTREEATSWHTARASELTAIRPNAAIEPENFGRRARTEQLTDHSSFESPNLVEDSSRAFLRYCNEREVRWEQARRWFEAQGILCERLMGDAESWYLLLVSQPSRPDTGLGVPAVRRAMGAVPLADYFDLTRYNGLDPLEPESVMKFPEIRLDDHSVVQKGLIHGR